MQTLKSLLVTVLVLGGAFLAYDRYLAPEADKVVFKPAPTPKTEPPSAPPPSEATAPPAPISSPAPTPAPEAPQPEPSAASVAAMPSAPPPAPPVQGFAPPTIPSVEDATSNWTMIPASAFPRTVKLLQGATFKAGFGSTQVGAGTTVTVLAAQKGTLTIAPNATSALRATVPLEGTDLKAVLTQIYEAWKVRRIADAKRAWEQRDAKPVVAVSPPPVLDAAGPPQRATDGSYPLLLASMKSGAVTDVTPQSITRWGEAEKGEVNGKPGWIVPIEFNVMTAFGQFSTEAIAKICEGRVVGWYFKGSGEVIP